MSAIQRLSAWAMRALREHRLPLLILVPPIAWVVWQSDADTVFPLLVLPFVALLVGLALRPRHVWLLWLGSVVIEWIAVGLMGKYDDPSGNETAASIMIEAFAWMLFGVLIPVALGRLIRTDLIDEGRHAG